MRNTPSIVKIAVVGDHSSQVKAHVAIPKALALAAAELGIAVEATWFRTAGLNGGSEESLRGFHGIWCAPGSPYESMDGALRAIRFARERAVPFLGTCGGSQHALIEYGRNVLNIAAADHTESNPDTSFPLITALPCALREVEARIRLKPGSRVHALYGRDEIMEPFNCGFGLNPGHHSLFDTGPLKISATGDDGIARAVELDGHPFFIGTLFQPERSAFKDTVHPLVVAFLKAARNSAI